MENTAQKLLDKYGAQHQTIKAMEELSECVGAISEYLNFKSSKNIEHIMEEMADVEIMFTQLKLIFGHEACEIIKAKKLKKAQGYLLGEERKAIKMEADEAKLIAHAIGIDLEKFRTTKKTHLGRCHRNNFVTDEKSGDYLVLKICEQKGFVMMHKHVWGQIVFNVCNFGFDKLMEYQKGVE